MALFSDSRGTPDVAGPGGGALSVRVLGGFQVSVGERAVDDASWRLTKARSLVKLLALSPAYSLHREQAIDVLWPDLSPEAGANNLHQVLFAARRALAALAADGDAPTIQFQRQILSLKAPDGIWVDVDAFEELAAEATLSDDITASYDALAVYAGDLLPEDRYEDWAAERRERVRDRYLMVLARLARLHEEQGEYQPAIDVLRRLITADPAQEQSHVALMRLYALTGRPQQALRQYERLREILEREFDAEPDPSTDRLYTAILDRRFPPPEQRAAAVPPPPVASPAAMPSPAPEAPAPAAPARDSPPVSDFVDRVAELDILRTGLDQMLARDAQVMLLSGEAGIGKTRLATEAAAYASGHDARVVWGRCYDGEGAPAYWPWTQVVRGIAADLTAQQLSALLGSGSIDMTQIVPEARDQLPTVPGPVALDPEQERFRLFDSVTRFLTAVASAQPLVITLDNLHWADRSSLQLLEFLVDQISDVPLAVIGTYRDEGVDRTHPLSRTLATLARRDATRRVALQGIGADDIATLSRVRTGIEPPPELVEVIYQQTEGNPFFVSEVVKLLAEEGRLDRDERVRSWKLTVPQGVREAIGLRLDRLSPAANQALTIAAVIGREFELAVLEAVADLPPDSVLPALEEALAVGALTETLDKPGYFRFSHALIRQTLYEEMSNARRSRLHLRIGETIERLHAADPRPHLSDLAYHFYMAAPSGGAQAIDYAVLAAEHAMAQVAYAEAADHLARALQALDLVTPLDDERRCELMLRLGEAQKNAGDSFDARDTFRQAAGIARAGDDAAGFARAALGFEAAGLYSVVADEEGVQLLEEALDMVGARDVAMRARLLARLAEALWFEHGSLERRRALSREAVELARTIADDQMLASALISRLEDLWGTGSLDDRLRDATEARQLAIQAGDQRLNLMAHVWLVHDLLEAGDIVSVDREIESWAALATELRQPQTDWSLLVRRTMRALMSGRFDTAEDLASEALTIGRKAAAGPAELTHFVHLFAIRQEQGRLGELEDVATSLAEQNPSLPIFRCLLAILHLELDRHDTARRMFEREASDSFSAIPRDLLWIGCIARLAEACWMLRDIDSAGILYEIVLPYADRNIVVSNSICMGSAGRILGLLATIQERWHEAERHFEQAHAMNARMDALPLLAHSTYAHAQMLLVRAGRDDITRARRLLDEAREITQRLDMARLSARVQELTALGQARHE